MARKSSKTAHVLNLLSGGDEKAELELKNEENTQSDSPKPEESEKAVPENLQNAIKDTIEHTIKDTLQDTLKQKEPLPEINITANQASIQTPNPITTQVNSDTKVPSPSASDTSGEDPIAELIKNSLIEEHKELLDADTIETEYGESAETEGTATEDTLLEKSAQDEPQLKDNDMSASDDELLTMDSDDVTSPKEEAHYEEAGHINTDEEVSKNTKIEQNTPKEVASEKTNASFEPDSSQEDITSQPVETSEETIPDSEKEADVSYQYVNVMEYVVKDKVLYYMEQFGMCTCNRCMDDTTALSLTNLPPKYVVVDKHAVSPLLNFYSNKFVGQVTVELTKACITVKDYPHHDS